MTPVKVNSPTTEPIQNSEETIEVGHNSVNFCEYQNCKHEKQS